MRIQKKNVKMKNDDVLVKSFSISSSKTACRSLFYNKKIPQYEMDKVSQAYMEQPPRTTYILHTFAWLYYGPEKHS